MGVPRRVVLVGLMVGLSLVACGGSSATPSHPAGGTGSAESSSGTASPAKESMMAFELTSPAFAAGTTIPTKYSCDGENVSPPLTWQGAPDAAASLALIVDDPDARGFVQWVAFDLDGSPTGGLAEGISSSPDAPPQGSNDFRRVGWGGPCPPSGTHRYRFRLYALDAVLRLTGTPKAADLRAAMEGHIIGEAELVATYTRGG